MSDVAIRVENLSKVYRIGQPTPALNLGGGMVSLIRHISRGRLGRQLTHEKPNIGQRDLWALRDVSFEVPHGEVLGVIGRNGAGKSTLLKILSRITEPTGGWAEINGRVAALLQVGTGFHPELSGRENIYLNGSILGMPRSEIDRRFDEIVDFADLEKFLDTPLKAYSSGMRARLGFAVVSCLDSDVLMLDEILSVGDAFFREKSLQRMNSMVADGRTVLFVSHNTAMVQRICSQVMLLEDGRISSAGSPDDVIGNYLSRETGDEAEFVWSSEARARIPGILRPMRLTLKRENGELSNRFKTTEPVNIEYEYEVLEAVSNLHVGISLSTSKGEIFCVAWDESGGNTDLHYKRKAGRYISRCTFPADVFANVGLMVGVYSGVHGAEKTFRDPEVLNIYFDAASSLGEFGRTLIRPRLDWLTEYAGQ